MGQANLGIAWLATGRNEGGKDRDSQDCGSQHSVILEEAHTDLQIIRDDSYCRKLVWETLRVTSGGVLRLRCHRSVTWEEFPSPVVWDNLGAGRELFAGVMLVKVHC